MSNVAPLNVHETVDSARSLKLLIADDSPASRKLAEFLLRKLGHEVTSVEDGEKAVRLAKTIDYDGILMDVEMPVMGGLQATQEIVAWAGQNGRAIPIFGITAHTHPAVLEACFAAGMTGSIQKPFQREQLAAALGELQRRVSARVSGATSAKCVEKEDSVTYKTVLLVDDSPVECRQMAAALVEQNVRVVLAADGLEAIKLFAQQPFDGVIVNLSLAYLSGKQVIQCLRGLEAGGERQTPVAVVTANHSSAVRLDLLSIGVDKFVRKPLKGLDAVCALGFVDEGSVSQPASAQSSRFDYHAALRRVGGDAEMLAEMISLFDESADGMLADLELAIRSGDFDEVMRAAHSLKGALSSLTVDGPYVAAQRIEHAALDGQLSDIPSQFSELQLEVTDLRHWMRTLPRLGRGLSDTHLSATASATAGTTNP